MAHIEKVYSKRKIIIIYADVEKFLLKTIFSGRSFRKAISILKILLELKIYKNMIKQLAKKIGVTLRVVIFRLFY